MAEQEDVSTILFTLVAFEQEFITFRVPFIHGSMTFACKIFIIKQINLKSTMIIIDPGRIKIQQVIKLQLIWFFLVNQMTETICKYVKMFNNTVVIYCLLAQTRPSVPSLQ